MTKDSGGTALRLRGDSAALERTAEECAMKTNLVLGAAGFIGSELVRQLLVSTEEVLVAVDRSRAVEMAALPEYSAHAERLTLLAASLDDADELARVFAAHEYEVVIHCAESDPTLSEPQQVWRTLQVLEAVTAYWRELPAWKQGAFRLLQVTDAGSSSAVCAQLARSYAQAHGVPTLLVSTTTAYGPHQAPNALVPQVVADALIGRKILVDHQGEQVSAWLHVSDVCRGLLCVLDAGEPGRSYHLSGEFERSEMEVVTSVCRALDELELGLRQRPTSQLIRYASAPSPRAQLAPLSHGTPVRELGWRPAVDFESGIRHTVRWYLDRPHWRADYFAARQSAPKSAPPAGQSPSERFFLSPSRPAEIEGVVFESLDKQIDGRGWQAPVFADSSPAANDSAWRLSASETRPGITRGPIEERDRASYLGFTGPGEFRLYLWDCRIDSPTFGARYSTVVGESNPLSVTIPAGVVYAYRNIGDQSGLVFTLGPRSGSSPTAALETASSML